MSNTDLWDRVCKTDPKHVKPITGKQYSGNSPKPYYIVRRLTEEFGPIGKGWGVKILNERFERLSEHDVLHVARIWFWHGTESCGCEQMGQTKAAYMTSKGTLLVDEDAPKKSVTDALVKCASYLGFAGDIFMGMWDDSKYVAGLKKEFAEESGLERDLKASIAAVESVKSPGIHSPNHGAGDGLDPERKELVEQCAAYLVECFDAKDEAAVVRAWFQGGNFDTPDERAYCWRILQPHSQLRALLQANSPDRDHKPKPEVVRMSPGPGLKKIGKPITNGVTQ